jgi:hypothetical protein
MSGLIVNSEGSLEILLAQHMFTAFMWAVAKSGVSAQRIDLKGQTTIGHPDAFRLDNSEALLSLRHENSVLVGMANAIQQSGLGSLQEAYLCIIPPLSFFHHLPIEPVVDFVRWQMRDYEVLGRWEKVVPVYIQLFRVCKSFETTPHEGFHKATAILIHIFLSVCYSLKLQQEQQHVGGVEQLQRLKDGILEELNPKNAAPKSASLCGLICNFAKLYKIQNRLDKSVWEDLAIDVASEVENSGDIHTIFQHPTVFSKIMTMGYRKVKDIGPENVNVRDILGWTPLHYAAVRKDEMQKELVIQELLNLGADPKATDLAGWTPLHYTIDTAVKEEKLELVMWTLLQGGADIEMRGRDGIGLLHCAAKTGHIPVTTLLLHAGVNIEIQDNSRMTPIH